MDMASATASLATGLNDPVFDSQSCFRAILSAMSFPGRVQTLSPHVLPPQGLDPATALAALSLCDQGTAIFIHDDAAGDDKTSLAGTVSEYLRFHCDAPIVNDPSAADFALLLSPQQMPALSSFNPGEDRYPDRSTTLIVQVPDLQQGPGLQASGPGINGGIEFTVSGLPDDFWQQWASNHGRYPRGVDIIFCCDVQIVGVPRSTRIEL